jgi:hypothetical protein
MNHYIITACLGWWLVVAHGAQQPLLPASVAAKENTEYAKPADQPSGSDAKSKAPGRAPFILVLPAYRNCDRLIKAWNDGLGRVGDLVVCMPGPRDLKDPTTVEAIFRKVKHGSLGIVTPSAALFLRGDAKLPASASWLWYDPEPYWPHTPQKEKDDPLAAAKALRKWCNKHRLKLGMTPIYAPFERNFDVEYAAKVAIYCDAYILQCQDWQNDPQKVQRITQHLQQLEKAIHKANPKCLVGCQLGAAKRYGGVEAALKLYDATKGFIQLYTAWWEPEEQTVMELLGKLNVDQGPLPAEGRQATSQGRNGAVADGRGM